MQSHGKRNAITLQKHCVYTAIAPLLHSNRTAFVMWSVKL